MFDIEQLKGALSQLGVPISRSEAEEVMEYYSKRAPASAGGQKFFHAHLLQDAVRGSPSFLEVDQGITQRLLGSARSEASLLGLPKSTREETLVVKAFRNKLRETAVPFQSPVFPSPIEYIFSLPHSIESFRLPSYQEVEKRVREMGGTPYQVLRDAFFKWDRESSGTVTSEQLRGALRSLKMSVSSTQAKEVEKFYAKKTSPSKECDYMALVRDVTGSDRSPLVHNIHKKGKDPTPNLGQAAATMAGEEGSGNSSGRSSSRPEDYNLSFSGRPHLKPRNRLVERFKLRLRNALEKRVRRKGGAIYSIIRQNFLQLDADASEKIDLVELKRASNRMGVSITEEEAATIVMYYDLDGSGEMSYDLLCREISPVVNPVLPFVEEVDVPKDAKREILEVPRVVSRAVERVRAGVIDVGRRMEGPSSSKLLLPIFLRDVLMGTCIRFDWNDTGVLDPDKLEQVWRELKITLRRSEVAALVDWLGRGATHTVRISDLCNAVFGEGGTTTSRSSAASPHRQNHPLLPPPRPRDLQAQRSAALAMRKSISATFRSPAVSAAPPGGYQQYPLLKQGQRNGHGGPLRKRKCAASPPLESKKVWNNRQKLPPEASESRRRRVVPSLAAATRPEGPGDGRGERRYESVGVDSDGGCGGGVSNGAALPADGGDVVATEKMMIERRLKELQQEKVNLLRRRKRMKQEACTTPTSFRRCWGEGRGNVEI